MSYSQFTTLRSVKKQFGVVEKRLTLFEEVLPIEPSAWLLQTLAFASSKGIALFSEKSRSESIVFPILLEIHNRHEVSFSLYSGANMEADKNLGLSGECDFILSHGEQSIEVTAPVFCVVEAKDNDIEMGIPQCVAQMLGARMFNEQDGLFLPVIYGCVTTGEDWQFLKLEGHTVFLDTKRYYLAKLEELLGVLDDVVKRLEAKG